MQEVWRRRKQQDHGLRPQVSVWKPSLGCTLAVREMLVETPMPNVGPGSPSAAENVPGGPGGALAEQCPVRAPCGPTARGGKTGKETWASRCGGQPSTGWKTTPVVFRSLALCRTLSWLLLQPGCFCVWVFVIVFVFLVSGGKSQFPSCFSLKSPRTNESVSWKNLGFPTKCANSKES